MAYNVPAGDKKRLTFGPGVLYMGNDVLSTPTQDVGYCRGCTITITRTKMDVFQGSPKALIETYAIQEDVALNFTALQWNPNNLARALGAGVTASGVTETLEFGGSMSFTEHPLKFLHVTPYQATVEIRIWRAQAVGEVSLAFGDDLQEQAFNFRALEATTNWSSVALAANKRLCWIGYMPAP